jgi:serine/threonine protein kinase
MDDALLGSLVDGRYRIDEVVGRGGFGVVYASHHVSLDQRIALKVLRVPEEADEEKREALIQRFAFEGRTLPRLRHPNIVSAIDLGVVDVDGRPTPYIAMEWCEGPSLDEHLAMHGKLTPAAALAVLVPLVDAMACAHELGIVHRDLKPSNVMLRPTRGPGLDPRVIDFGIAKLVERGDEPGTGRTRTTSRVSPYTPAYASPEQIVGARTGPWTDVHALGLLYVTMVTGERPFGKDELAGIRVVEALRPTPARFGIDVGSVEEVIARALALRPSDRWTDARALQRAIHAATSPQSDGARAKSSVETAPHSDTEIGSAPTELESSDEVRALVGTTIGGKYRLERVLGRGGMGAVYEAVDDAGGLVAVKVVLEAHQRRRDILRRFVREAKLTMAIDHSNVVRVLDVDDDSTRGVPYIAMELLAGTDLDRHVRVVGALEPRAAVRLFIDACRGLSAAHALGIVHRDVKPANIFLHRSGGGPDAVVAAKICDFGVAKNLDDADGAMTQLTTTGGTIGSPPYMSPEQARSSKHIDETSDVWSLGVTLYEALSGERPFRAASFGELMVAIIAQPVPSLQSAAPWIEPELAKVVHRALSKDPKERFPTMAAFADALAPFALPLDQPLTASVIIGVDAKGRRHVAPSMDGILATELAGSAPDVERPPVPASSRSRTSWLVAAGAVSAFAVAGFVWSARVPDRTTTPSPIASSTGSAPSPSATMTAAASAPLPEIARVTGTLLVHPASASVSVNGAVRPLSEGRLVLEGAPGDSFVVVASASGREARKEVFLGANGKTSIDRIDVPLAAATVASKIVPIASTSAPKVAPPVAPSGSEWAPHL